MAGRRAAGPAAEPLAAGESTLVAAIAAGDQYVRAAEVVTGPHAYHDGDTVLVEVDLGFYMQARLSCRFAGINANELTEPGGPEAAAAVADLLAQGPVTVQSTSVDKFAGRFDGIVVVAAADGPVVVNDWLVAHGLAVRWNGRGPKPKVPWPPPQP